MGVSFEKNTLVIICLINPLDCRKREGRQLNFMFGLLRAKINQAISGIASGFNEEIELAGVGYKAELLCSNKLLLKLGYSHDILIDIPENIIVICPKETL